MGYEWLAIAMFVGFFFIMMSGYPVGFSFAGAAILFLSLIHISEPTRPY